jgi:hypothetical protein
MEPYEDVFKIDFTNMVFNISSTLDKSTGEIIINDFLRQLDTRYTISYNNSYLIYRLLYGKLEQYIDNLIKDGIIDDKWQVNQGWLLYKSINNHNNHIFDPYIHICEI